MAFYPALQQHTALWWPGLASLGMPALWAAGALLLRWADPRGPTRRHDWLLAWLPTSPHLAQRLLTIDVASKIGSWDGWLWARVPELVLACWLVGPAQE